MTSISLSTAWNGGRCGSLPEALREARALGFDAVELYAHWRPADLAALKPVLAELGLRVSSLHGPCPVPVDDNGERSPCGDWLAELDEQKRRLAVDAHRRTVDAAAELGARAVVVHLGTTGARSLQREIFQAIREHGFGSPAHRALLQEAIAERRRAAANGTLEAAIRSAREIGEHARGSGVGIGLECRDGFVEIPGLDDYPSIFAACADLPVYYWHDVGHGSKLQNAGFLEAEDYLRRYGERLLGMHLHDTTLDRDHQAPGQGETDFTLIARYLRPETIRTLELSPRVPIEHIQPGLETLRRAGVL